MSEPLPYHCPTLKADFTRFPCDGQVAAAEKHRQKFPHVVMPYGLEQCLKCKGAVLVVRGAPEGGHTGPPLQEPEAVGVKAILHEEQGMGKSQEETKAAEAPRCPRHPEEPQIACAPESKRTGQYLGACKVCMAERKSGRKPAGVTEKMSPAVARDLRKAPEPPAKPPVRQNDPDPPKINVQAASDPGQNIPPRCLTHNLPIKFNAKGISMGGCVECRREIAAMGGHKARIKLAENPLERVFAGYAEELAWLLDFAREQMRTPEAQLVCLCRWAKEEERK